MATFVLVHGAWHASWCWERLEPPLAERGHRVIAMDLPVDDGAATLEDYAGTVVDAMRTVEGPVVLVGHSLSGVTIPLVAAQRPVEALVFLCALVPVLGGNPWDDGPEMGASGIYDALVESEDGSTTWPTLESATAAFYNDCDPVDAARAFSRLRAMNPSSLWGTPYPLREWPPANRISIAGTFDQALTLEWAHHAASTRLHVPVIELPTGHSPMISQPEMLADVLDTVTRRA